MFRSIRWQIAFPFALVAAASILIFGFFTAARIYTNELERFTIFAVGQTEFIADLLAAAGDSQSSSTASQAILDQAQSQIPETNFVLYSPQGTNLADPADATSSLLVRNAPEFQGALAGTAATDVRQQPGENHESLLVAVPLFDGEEIVSVLRGTYSTASLVEIRRNIRVVTLLATLGMSLASLAIAALISERSFRPLRALTRSAEEIAVVEPKPEPWNQRDELSQLTLAFNTMSMQLRSQIEALTSERSKLTTVLQQMSDGVIIADNYGRIQLFNRTAEKLFLIKESEAMGRSLAEILRDHRLVELWKNCIESGEEQSVYLEFRQPSLSLQCIATPLAGGLPGSVLLLFQDLTRLRRLETVRRDFISNISHELRTPLASLKALAETLQDGALEDPPAARHFLKKMETEVDALTHMVSELLELSRIESGRVPLQFKPVRPLDLLVSARDRLIVQAERNQLSVHLDCDPDLPEVLADPIRLQQVIVNLLHNAIKFTPAGGEITLAARSGDEEIIFSVQDTGVGIPAEDLSRIFERFYKTDRARSTGGTGLGLAISRHTVEAHSGRIWAESVETRGSTFYFSVPTA